MVALIGVVLVLLLVGVGVYFSRGRVADAPAPVVVPAPAVEVRKTPEPGPEALPPKHSSSILRQVSNADIELEIRSGRVFNAIRLYREQTGADAQEARSAVEAWRNRLTAS